MNGVKCKDFFKPGYKNKICGILRMIFMPSIFKKIAVPLTYTCKSRVKSKLFRTWFSIFSVFSFQVKCKFGPGNRHTLNVFSIYLFHMGRRDG